MREYLDKAIKADQCAQYVDNIGIAAKDSTQLCINIKTVFECIREAGLKLAMAKCHFGVKQVDFLGRTMTPEGVSPQTKSQTIPSETQISDIQKSPSMVYWVS